MFKAQASAIAAALLVAAPLFSAPAFAAEPAAKDLNPWVDCGIGAMIFPGTPVGAVISNVIWDWGLTATTSAMSSRQTCEGERAKVAMFINTNYAQLIADTANGRGEHLTAIGQMLDCDKIAQSTLATRVRAEMPAMIARPGFDALPETRKAEAYYQVVDTVVRTELSSACKAA